MGPVSDGGSFHEIAKGVRIEFAIPFVSVALGALTLGCFGLTAIIPEPAVLAACTIGTLAGLAAVGLPVWAALRRPELLRSERHILMSRAFDVMLDKGATKDARSQAAQIIQGALIADVAPVRVSRLGTNRHMISGTEDRHERPDE